MTAQIAGHSVVEDPDRLIVTFTLQNYRQGEPRQPIVMAASKIAISYLHLKGWTDANGNVTVNMHMDALNEPEDGKTLVMGWHLPGRNPGGCRHCE